MNEVELKDIQIDIQKAISRRGLEVQGRVQRFIDSEVLRLTEPYVPRLTGALINSGTINTRVGSGQVIYKTPYARRQYYENKGSGRRGKQWFERMKANHVGEILQGAARIAGAKGER